MSTPQHTLPTDLDFDTWLKFGMDQGWCGPPVCEPHDGFPMSSEEWATMEVDGEPPCMHMLRLYTDTEHKDAIEEAHSPSQWRNPFR